MPMSKLVTLGSHAMMRLDSYDLPRKISARAVSVALLNDVERHSPLDTKRHVASNYV